MKIIKAGSRPQKQASSEYFQGNVFQDVIIESPKTATILSFSLISSSMRLSLLCSSKLRTVSNSGLENLHFPFLGT